MSLSDEYAEMYSYLSTIGEPGSRHRLYVCLTCSTIVSEEWGPDDLMNGLEHHYGWHMKLSGDIRQAEYPKPIG